MAQTQRISKNNTKITTENGYKVITLHKTKIVKVNANEIILDFGGYDSVTTRARMNQVSNELGLGYGVYREKGTTYVGYKGETFEYQGFKMLLNRDTGGFNHVSDDRG